MIYYLFELENDEDFQNFTTHENLDDLIDTIPSGFEQVGSIEDLCRFDGACFVVYDDKGKVVPLNKKPKYSWSKP